MPGHWETLACEISGAAGEEVMPAQRRAVRRQEFRKEWFIAREMEDCLLVLSGAMLVVWKAPIFRKSEPLRGLVPARYSPASDIELDVTVADVEKRSVVACEGRDSGTAAMFSDAAGDAGSEGGFPLTVCQVVIEAAAGTEFTA